jgi:hypothetical protein
MLKNLIPFSFKTAGISNSIACKYKLFKLLLAFMVRLKTVPYSCINRYLKINSFKVFKFFIVQLHFLLFSNKNEVHY